MGEGVSYTEGCSNAAVGLGGGALESEAVAAGKDDGFGSDVQVY